MGQSWGPTGRLAPHTPAYGTAASHTVADLAALQTLLLGGTVNSGEVIEVTSTTLSGAAYTTHGLKGGDPTWAQNVLVRPPLGRRASIDRLDVQTQHVTFGGLDATIGFTTNEDTIVPTRTGYYRCTLANPEGLGSWNLNDSSVGCFLSECVSPYTYYGTPGGAGTDRDGAQFSCPGPTLMDGCYLNQRLLEVLPSIYNLETTDLTIRDINTTMSGLSAPFGIQHVRVATPGSFAGGGESVTVAFKKNGVTFLTLTSPSLTNSNNGVATSAQFSDYAFGKNPSGGPYATVSNGDVLTVSITNVVGTPDELIIEVGQPSAAHLDSFQIFGTINDTTFTNNVIIGSENSGMQLQQLHGLFRLSHNFIVQNENYSVNLDATSTDLIAIIDRNICIGKFYVNQVNGQEYHIENNIFNSFGMRAGSLTLSPSNDIISTIYPIPPDLPDLTVVWPECPFIPVHPHGNRWPH